MDIIKRYDIHFKGLDSGTHNFEFHIDSEFFEAFENTDIKSGDIAAMVELTKSSGMFSLIFRITGSVGTLCDRCLEECRLPVDIENRLYVKFGEADSKDCGEEILWLNRTESELNVAQHIYESIILGLPIQRVHPEDANGAYTCNPDMLDRFTIPSEDREEGIFNESTQKMEKDPQWDKLRKISM